jgi:hypothetical protein
MGQRYKFDRIRIPNTAEKALNTTYTCGSGPNKGSQRKRRGEDAGDEGVSGHIVREAVCSCGPEGNPRKCHQKRRQ